MTAKKRLSGILILVLFYNLAHAEEPKKKSAFEVLGLCNLKVLPGKTAEELKQLKKDAKCPEA